MKKNRLFLIIFLLIGLFTALFFIQDTLAKYRKNVDQDVRIALARWNIKLNGDEIYGKSKITSKITPVFNKSEYVADEVLAPGVTGYFDVEIDASDVDVSFTYKLTSVVDNVEEYPDIIVYGYTVDPDNNDEMVPYSDEGIVGTIEHNAEKVTKIRLHIKWDDSETNSMDNAKDTALAIANSEILMRGSFTFVQIKD